MTEPAGLTDCSARVPPGAPSLPVAGAGEAQLRARGIRVLRAYRASFPPRLSVIIPMFNTAQWIDAAIQSALDQTEPSIEVVVVDDGSTDGGLDRVLAFDDDRLTVITQPNQGLSAARNSGIMVARAELLGLLDGDDIWYPAKVERHLALHASVPALGISFDWSAYLDEGGDATGQYLISWCAQPDPRALARRNHIGNGSSGVVRRACFVQAGLFDEALRSCEDLDMWIRIAAHTRFGLRLLPEVLTGYRVREGSLSLTFDTFVHAAERLQQRVASDTPGLGEEDGHRCLAQLLRITSRKALADGQVKASRRLLWRALRSHPATVLADTRGLVLTAIHLGTLWLPAHLAYGLYAWTANSAGTMAARQLRRKGRLAPVVTG